MLVVSVMHMLSISGYCSSEVGVIVTAREVVKGQPRSFSGAHCHNLKKQIRELNVCLHLKWDSFYLIKSQKASKFTNRKEQFPASLWWFLLCDWTKRYIDHWRVINPFWERYPQLNFPLAKFAYDFILFNTVFEAAQLTLDKNFNMPRDLRNYRHIAANYNIIKHFMSEMIRILV